jgi:hypothetical protein
MLETHILQLLIAKHFQRHLEPLRLLTKQIPLPPFHIPVLALSSSGHRRRGIRLDRLEP